MKSIFAIVIFSSVVYLVHPALLKDFSAKVASAKKKCQDEFKVDVDGMEELYWSGKESDDDNVKCALSCLFKEFNYLKEGQVNLQAYAISNALKYPGDDANIEKANKIAKECSENVKNSGNECIYASSLAVCMTAGAKRDGLPRPQLQQS